jgi:hypothetical protein
MVHATCIRINKHGSFVAAPIERDQFSAVNYKMLSSKLNSHPLNIQPLIKLMGFVFAFQTKPKIKNLKSVVTILINFTNLNHQIKNCGETLLINGRK